MNLKTTTIKKVKFLNLLKSLSIAICLSITTSMYSNDFVNTLKSTNTITDTESPTTPTGLSITYDEGNDVTWLSWNASTDNVGVDYYVVYDKGESVYALDQTKLGFGGKLDPNRTYIFTIEAIDKSGNKSAISLPLTVSPQEPTGPCDGIEEWKSGVTYQVGDKVTYRGNLYELKTSRWAFISSCDNSISNNISESNSVDTEAPTAPTNLSATYDQGNDATWLSWNPSIDNVGIDYYIVYDQGKFVYALDQTKLGFGGKLDPTKTYVFTIEAVDKAGNKSELSAPLTILAEEPTSPCDGIEEWRSGVTYQTGDRVTYRNNLYERQTFRWAFISSCGAAKSANNITPTENSTISVFPNPATKTLNISAFNLSEKTTYNITDMQGRVITQGAYKTTLNIESLPKGIYMFNLTSNATKKGVLFVKK